MAEYRCHWSPSASDSVPAVTLEADSHVHGAALALRQFAALGCDLAAPFAHLDVIAPNGASYPVLLSEVREWLSDPAHADLIQREGLAALFDKPRLNRT